MKQKLLNSFTWRGTLLVALLSCAFSSAWGQGSTTLTFRSDGTPVSDDDVTWAISGNYDTNNTAFNSPCSFTVSSSIKGKIKEIVVEAKSANNGNKGIVSVSVNGNTFGNSQNPSAKSFESCKFNNSGTSVDVNGINKIVVSGASNNGKLVYIRKITVTYESAPQFTISDACHGIADEKGNVRNFGTYSYEYPFKVPAATIGENGNNDLKVFTINVEGDALHLNQLSEGTIVPANTGVLVSATAGGTYDAVLTLASGEALDDNMLVASSKEMSTVPGNNKFYHLSMKNGNIGFYWGVDGGGSWDFNGPKNDQNPNKAYLAVPVPQNSGNSIKGFAFGDGTNSIKGVESEKSESNAIYNLAGQRVSKMQKGLYIVNGKKMIQR